MCIVKRLKILAAVLSAVPGMGIIPQSIFLFVLRRMISIFKNKSISIPLGKARFPIFRSCGPGEVDPVLSPE